MKIRAEVPINVNVYFIHSKILPPFQNVGRFVFSRFIYFMEQREYLVFLKNSLDLQVAILTAIFLCNIFIQSDKVKLRF